MDFCVNFSAHFLGPSVPLNEGQKIHREIHSKIHDKIPARSTHVVKNGVRKSTLHEEERDASCLSFSARGIRGWGWG